MKPMIVNIIEKENAQLTPRCTGAKCILISPLSSFSYFFLNYQVHHEDIFALSSMQNCITARDGDPGGEAPLLE